jgi:predicted MPP superfamily phosphohydrolase
VRPSAGFFVFLSVFIGLWSGLHYYVYRNLAAAGLPELPLAAAIWILGLSFPAARIVGFRRHGPAARLLHWVASIWMGVGFLLAFWFYVAFLIRWALSAAGFHAWTGAAPWAAGTAAFVALLGALGMYRALGGPREVRYRVDRAARYGAGNRKTLVQISDVHLGLILGTDYLRALVDRINALRPDAVLITGDFLDPEFPDDEGAIRELRRLKARDGIFAVSGNHEFYAGIRRFLSLMEKAGVRVLENETVVTESGLQVAGIHDQTAGNSPARGVVCDLGRALAGIDGRRPSVLLAHQPRQLEPAAGKRVDLVLSGHTHAGQIFPFRALVRLAFRHVAGRHRLGPDTELIVCTGTGFWGPPLRVGTESQLVIVDFAW